MTAITPPNGVSVQTGTTDNLSGALTAIGAGVNIVAVAGSDISAQIIAAQATLGAAGGKIYIPAGIFYVQNVPLIDGIYYEGAGETATQLKLPNGATHSMFVAAGSLIYGWGFKGIYFSGRYDLAIGSVNSGGTAATRSIYNCIDCTAASAVQEALITDCRFEYFNAAYRGALGTGTQATSFDWYPRFINCVFEYNNNAIIFSEHVHLTSCFFYLNGTTAGAALTGGGALTGRFNDCTVRNCWFISNYNGAYPAATFTIFNTQFIGCLFAAQANIDLLLDSYNVVSGCAFWGVNYAIQMRVGNNTITGNKFNEGASASYLACIKPIDGGSIVGFYNITISNNVFNCSDASAGPCIDLSGITNSSSNSRAWSISANTMATNRTQFIKKGASTALEDSFSVMGNSFYVSGDYTTATAIALIEAYNAAGNTITGNAIFLSAAGTKLNFIGGVLLAGVVSGNLVSNPNAGTFNMILAGSTVSGTTIQTNVGYKTRNSGVATLTAATSVVVTHGLANTPSINDIALTSNGSGALTPPYVSTVTSTQFTINITGTTTANISWIASCNN